MDADGRVGLKSATAESLNRARAKTRGFPRALEALYAILSVDRYTTLEELLEISLPDEVVQKLVGEAFNRLDPSAQKVMQALAVYNRPVSPAAVDYLLQPHLPSIDSALVLNRLVNMHFARHAKERYYLHPADREYAFSTITEGAKIKGEINFTRYGLLTRAADYFAQARKPRTEWKKLNDIAAPLAEFDLRCMAGDYEDAGNVLREFDDYLDLWGHYRLMIDLHENIAGNISSDDLRLAHLQGLGIAYIKIGKIKESIAFLEQGLSTGLKTKNPKWRVDFCANLGLAYANLGETRKSIEYYNQALVVAQETGNKLAEGNTLGNLGNRYETLGNINKAKEYHEQALVIASSMNNKREEGYWLGGLGDDYSDLGQILKAIEYYDQALTIHREISNRYSERLTLSKLGRMYYNIGELQKANEFYEQELVISHEIGDHSRGEAIFLEGTGHIFLYLAENQKAKENYIQAIQIANKLLFPRIQPTAREGLAQTYLLQNDFINARAIIEAALQFDTPRNNYNTTTLHGIIALRQGERETAQEAFAKSIAQADEILAKTPDYYSALDAKGLALCGRVLSGKWEVESGKRDEVIAEAVETFRKARKIAPHAGVVKSVLRLFDELVKCDEEGVLKGVREVIEANPLVE